MGLFDTKASAAQVYFVTGAEFLASAVTGGHFDGPAVAEDAGAEFAFIVAQAVFTVFETDMGMLARDGGAGFVRAFFENDSVAPDDAMFGVRQLCHAADVQALAAEFILGALGFALCHNQTYRFGSLYLSLLR